MNGGSTLGVPDWTDAAAYPVELTDRQWWWEFTRRRPVYRAMWKTQSALGAPDNDTLMAADYQTLRLDFQMSRLLDPRKSYSDWRLMNHHYPTNGGFERDEYRRLEDAKYMMETPELRGCLEESIAKWKRLADLEEEAGIYHFTFNLKKPLKEQLNDAKVLLQHIQDELYGRQKRKPEKHKWPSYLRVLDARDLRASWSSIGEALWPGDKGNLDRARKHHKAAVGVRDHFPIIARG
jgi:hypothetical protein